MGDVVCMSTWLRRHPRRDPCSICREPLNPRKRTAFDPDGNPYHPECWIEMVLAEETAGDGCGSGCGWCGGCTR